MAALRQRLEWSDDGALHDGPRRYLMMRTDVLMGTVLRLSPQARWDWLQAWAAATREHGGESLQAYAAVSGADAATLAAITVEAAADLGWGRWRIEPLHDGGLQLQVHGSPFVHGWRSAQAAALPAPAGACGTPLCAPITGLFTALAGLLLPGAASATVTATETDCAALHDAAPGVCTFVARCGKT